MDTPELVETLHENVKYFRKKLSEIEWDSNLEEDRKFTVYGNIDQPILPIVFKDDPSRVFKIATKLKENGFLTGSVVAPACPLRTPRLRVTCCTDTKKDSIDRFVNLIKELAETTPVTKFISDLK
jgi:7-keto-8-aminopelargonate synthetase-like enzyme